MSDTAATLGFIGLGIMGLPMATHLLRAAGGLRVHTRTASKAKPLLDAGATWCDSPAELGGDCDIVFLCVSDTPDVREVLLGERGVIRAGRAGQVVVDHSTISPEQTRQIAGELLRQQITLLDAPVSGGDVGAKNATLSIMVGGPDDAFAQVRPWLEVIGRSIVHTGPVGTGQLTKLVNQILVSGTLLSVCEAVCFAARSGLDLEKTLAAVSGGAARSWQLEQLGPRIARGDYAPGFMIDLMLKDLRLVAEAAGQAGVTLRGTQTAAELFQAASRAGYGRAGTQALHAAVCAQHPTAGDEPAAMG